MGESKTERIEHSLVNSCLSKSEINDFISEGKLHIRPLLESSQVGEIGIDFRLGTDFLVSIQGREAFINASKNEWIDRGNQRDIYQFFQTTRRQIGETFILHPHQTVLAVSLEYIKLPENCFMKLYMRSSYSRLGITISTIAQPGYCGCLSLELTNNNNNPINLTVGARLVQGIIYRLNSSAPYFSSPRKYVCQVRPEPSAITADSDLNILNEMWKENNNRK
jgi:dCTP deaminase